tara:strand:- start:1648 stop:1893 length:246 start_codon:yes stop_codon:yes gene_type:complete
MSGELIYLTEYRKAKQLREDEEMKRELEAIDAVFAEILGSLPPPSDPVQFSMDDEAIFQESARLTHLIKSILETDNGDDDR